LFDIGESVGWQYKTYGQLISRPNDPTSYPRSEYNTPAAILRQFNTQTAKVNAHNAHNPKSASQKTGAVDPNHRPGNHPELPLNISTRISLVVSHLIT
jgi:hypothetical protein